LRIANSKVRGNASTGGSCLVFGQKKAIRDRKRRFQQMLVASCIAASTGASALPTEIAPHAQTEIAFPPEGKKA
jgi:hypothetical protein